MKFNTLRKFPNFNYTLKKQGVTSGGSRLKYRFQRLLPLNIFLKKHITTIKVKAGRILSGRIGIFSKSSWIDRKRAFSINYSFRLKFISFIANIIVLPFTHKIISLIVLSCGSVTYTQTSFYHQLFHLIKYYPLKTNINQLQSDRNLLNPQLFIQQGFFWIKQLPKNKPISLLELFPGNGIKYVRAPSTAASPIRLSEKSQTLLLRLPSGVRKVFSLLSLGSPGQVPLPENRYWKSNKAGFYRRFGKKSIVRGVAKNPVDHPHGGRTKTLHYPRTPWGKTTKFK